MIQKTHCDSCWSLLVPVYSQPLFPLNLWCSIRWMAAMRHMKPVRPGAAGAVCRRMRSFLTVDFIDRGASD